jgi:hypothetical protein
MATNFPTSVDSLVNPVSNDSLNSPSHSAQHANANDAIEAIEGYLLNGGQGVTLVKKQTIGTAVSSVVVTAAFSATYTNYLIKIVGGVGSTTASLNFQLGGITTGYYTSLIYSTFGAAAPAAASNANQSTWAWAGGTSTIGNYAHINVQNPFQSVIKTGTNDYLQVAAGGQTGISRYFNTETSSATGFIITPSSGTMTGGTIYVYGYGIGT